MGILSNIMKSLSQMLHNLNSDTLNWSDISQSDALVVRKKQEVKIAL